MKMKDILSPARGKINLKCDLFSYKTKTLKLKCGPGTGYLALDIDEPNNSHSRKLLSMINRDDFIVHSNRYTLDDVFSGNCRYKVIFKYNGKHIPNRRNNKFIEVFYSNSNKPVCIWGVKNDFENYIYSGKVRNIHFDINDILLEKVPFDLFNEKLVKNKKKNKKTNNKDNEEDNNLIIDNNLGEVIEGDINELKVILKDIGLANDFPMEHKNNFITFDCIFPELHSRKNYAYAFKIDNNYVVRCQGKVCYEQYAELNKKITKYILSRVKFDNFETFKNIKENKVNLFVAPTGWGKTERIAGEILKTINNNERLLVLMPDKTAISRLLDRVNEYSNNHLKILQDTNKIITYMSETKQRLTKQGDLILNANVIISHHYYFWNAGSLLTYYPMSWEILELDNLNVIIDEAHTFIERGTRLDLKIGNMYEKSLFNNNEVFRLNRKKLTQEQARTNGDKIKTNCLYVEKDKYGSFNFDLAYRVYENKDISYINIYSYLTQMFKKELEWEEGNMEYSTFSNSNISNIKKNEIKNTQDYETIITDLLLEPSENALLSINKGDDIERVKIGEVILTLFHYQIIKKVLNTPKQVILTTATIKPYHYSILKKVVNVPVEQQEIKTKIEKIKQIRLLWSEEKVNIKNNILEVLDNYNIKSLLFIQTIRKAKNLLKTYNHILLNDNGNYMFGKRKNESDYGDNIERNITVAGLESSVAKGYNYIEEINGKDGFEVLYFDGEPISPTRIKKYINNGEVKDHSSNYNMASLAQAIGRVFRKEKDVLTICLRGFKKETYNDILEYLKTTTTSNIIEGKLNITNFKIAISKLEKNTDSLLSGNSFYDKIKEVE